ncbi:hypothetical protein [Hymenobacter terricola]|uniref:hypothetical protein n=1 Tax=Hymenobacter terricola TaxID=2819236 RepID=UPI001B303232|nr:hypothetical protein [Hymenobacter terricola]
MSPVRRSKDQRHTAACATGPAARAASATFAVSQGAAHCAGYGPGATTPAGVLAAPMALPIIEPAKPRTAQELMKRLVK